MDTRPSRFRRSIGLHLCKNLNHLRLEDSYSSLAIHFTSPTILARALAVSHMSHRAQSGDHSGQLKKGPKFGAGVGPARTP